MDLFTLVARLGIDTSEYDSKIGKARSSFMQLGSTVSAKAVAFGTLTARMIEKAANAALELGKSTVQAAADIEAEKAQFVATFGEMQGAADKAFKNIEKSTGVFGTRLKNVGTKAFSQFKGAGLDGVDALEMMEKYTNLAADAAAYYDISLEDADARLRSFLRGNTEAGDAIGLFTSESQRNTYAMEEYGKKWLELTEAQKQMLMLNVSEDIYKQSGAIGQAARESSAWTNVIGNLQEVWRQAKAKFGAPIMAVITPKIQEFTEWLSGEGVELKLEQFGIGVANKINQFFNWAANPTFPTWEDIEADARASIDEINKALDGAITWALGELGYPDEAALAADVENWWATKVWPKAQEKVYANIGIKLPEWPYVKAKFSEWWKTTLPKVDEGLHFTLRLFGIEPWTEEDTAKLRAWWDGILPGIKNVVKWTLNPPEMLTAEDAEKTIAGIQAWWDTVRSNLQLKLNITPQVSQYHTEVRNAESTAGVIGTSFTSNPDAPWMSGIKNALLNLGGFATGLDYVPFNNFYARLHEGERVMTKAENMAYSRGGVQVIDYAAMGAAVGGAVREALNGIRLYTDDGTAIADLVTERVSRNIEKKAWSERFA